METGRWSWVMAVALVGAACHTRTPVAPARRMAPNPAPPPASSAAPAPAARARSAHTLTEEEQYAQKSLSELNAEHPLADAFFDYNQDVLRPEARGALQADAAWLGKWRRARIMIEGHCDERGTAEYNLALGERRAEVVTEYLTGLGVDPSRITMRSLGKEAPFCRDSGEACWSQNRRGHFVITDK